MKKYGGYLIDLDGTVYRGSDTVESGVRFVKRVQQAGAKCIFLTNNTTRTPEMVVNKLKGHGVETDIDHVYTPSLASVAYLLAKNPGRKKIPVYLIGQTGLFAAFQNDPHFYITDQHPEYVVMGMDTDLTYHKMRVATRAIRKGAGFIGTNADLNLPLGDELVPGNGSQCAMLAAATGKRPLYIGKPSPIIIEMALARYGLKKEETLIVGDNYQTDIMAGLNSGVDCLLTLTGVTQAEDIKDAKQPTYVVASLDEWK
jgi:4-nitrophenyl phosphatase